MPLPKDFSFLMAKIETLKEIKGIILITVRCGIIPLNLQVKIKSSYFRISLWSIDKKQTGWCKV